MNLPLRIIKPTQKALILPSSCKEQELEVKADAQSQTNKEEAEMIWTLAPMVALMVAQTARKAKKEKMAKEDVVDVEAVEAWALEVEALTTKTKTKVKAPVPEMSRVMAHVMKEKNAPAQVMRAKVMAQAMRVMRAKVMAQAMKVTRAKVMAQAMRMMKALAQETKVVMVLAKEKKKSKTEQSQFWLLSTSEPNNNPRNRTDVSVLFIQE